MEVIETSRLINEKIQISFISTLADKQIPIRGWDIFGMWNCLGEKAIIKGYMNRLKFQFSSFQVFLTKKYKLDPTYIKPTIDLQTFSIKTLNIFWLFVSTVNLEPTQSKKCNIIKNHKISNCKKMFSYSQGQVFGCLL